MRDTEWLISWTGLLRPGQRWWNTIGRWHQQQKCVFSYGWGLGAGVCNRGDSALPGFQKLPFCGVLPRRGESSGVFSSSYKATISDGSPPLRTSFNVYHPPGRPNLWKQSPWGIGIQHRNSGRQRGTQTFSLWHRPHSFSFCKRVIIMNPCNVCITRLKWVTKWSMGNIFLKRNRHYYYRMKGSMV